MAWKQGTVFACVDPECGCQVTVSRDSRWKGDSRRGPRCSCGKPMEAKPNLVKPFLV